MHAGRWEGGLPELVQPLFCSCVPKGRKRCGMDCLLWCFLIFRLGHVIGVPLFLSSSVDANYSTRSSNSSYFPPSLSFCNCADPRESLFTQPLLGCLHDGPLDCSVPGIFPRPGGLFPQLCVLPASSQRPVLCADYH